MKFKIGSLKSVKNTSVQKCSRFTLWKLYNVCGFFWTVTQ